jgi:hypothetical protein
VAIVASERQRLSPPQDHALARLRRAGGLEFLKETNQTGPRSTQNSTLKTQNSKPNHPSSCWMLTHESEIPACLVVDRTPEFPILDLDIVLYFATCEGGEALVKRGASHRAGRGNFSVN